MKLHFMGNIDELIRGIKILEKRLGYECSNEGMSIEVEKRNGPVEVVSDGVKAHIKYQEKIHFFRALGLLIENLREKTVFHISETPYFQTNGIMIDASRNAVMTVSSIKETLEIMAVMGLNMLMLYTEDTYEIKSQPYFGYMRGRYTYDELKECDDYAELFGIEMIPCIQTLAHLSSALKWNYAADIRDTDDILLAGEEKTYEFIEEMIKSASAPFRSNRIHIGMDEAHNIGLGRYLAKNGYRRRFDIINEHLDRVRKITDKLGLKPMMWSDMYFRLGSKTGAYYDDEAVVPEDVVENIPKDVQLVYWDYYHHDKEIYKKYIKRHQAFQCDVVFAGGIWTWSGIVVNYNKTFETTNAALSACKEEGIKEVFATMWGDNGAETNFFSGLLGLQLFAEHGYTDKVDSERLRKRFKNCTGGDMDAFTDISKLDYIPENEKETAVACASNPSKFLLWQDILIGLFDKHIENFELQKYYSALFEQLKKHAQQARMLQFVFDMPVKLAAVLAEKSELGLQIKRCYDSKDIKTLTKIAREQLPRLKELVEELRQEHRKQWLKVYKPFGWEVLDMRYGGLLARIDTAKYRLEQYLSGQLSKIDELEEERLYFDGPVRPKGVSLGRYNTYHRIVSASSLGF